MSRIGKKPITIPAGAKAAVQANKISVEGPKGKLELGIPFGIEVKQNGQDLIVTRRSDLKQDRTNHGTIRSRIVGMLQGVTTGHKKDLEIQGLGFRAQVQGAKVVFNLGFSHPVEFEIPKDVKVSVPTQTSIILEGADKVRVGQIAATIRALKKVEPYKGKGIRYVGQVVRRKQGKSVTK
ncbi:MAG: 50S ribosomal protein L6 [Candidatus Omnitrophica bacterium]|nr:50S ribosomal protein L6 [Candidatus Omnitrophota bacterium]